VLSGGLLPAALGDAHGGEMGHGWGTDPGKPLRIGADGCGLDVKRRRLYALCRAENAGRRVSARMPEEGLEPPTRGL
jgi:hypothetical protein